MTTVFDKQQAGVQMTLAGLAYVDEGLAINKLKQALIQELMKTHYATQGLWSLVWGPVVHGWGDNLVFVAQHAQTAEYSIVLRGTVEQRGSIWEDVPTEQQNFPFFPALTAEEKAQGLPVPKGKVSSHFLEAQQALLNGRDPDTGETLEQFFSRVGKQTEITIYVTGHSQGAGLVTVFVPWVLSQSQNWGGKVNCMGYGFAPPTAGDPDFANWLSQYATSFQVINPLDVVPFGYAGLKDIVKDKVPEAVPDVYRLAIDAAIGIAELAGHWQQPQVIIKLPQVQLPESIGYLDQVGAQHNHNSYLYLLDAPQTDSDPSILPKYR